MIESIPLTMSHPEGWGGLPYILKMPSNRIWFDYDEEVDVLYISFRRPQQANDSIMEDDIIYHYSNNELVGLTILHVKDKIIEKGK